MQTLDIQPIQNQNFTTTLDNNNYEISIYLAGGGMCLDLVCNTETLLSGSRIVGGQFLIPYTTYAGQNGNFILLTANYELPNYTKFGATQTLIYLSYDEILAAVAAA